MADGAKVLDRAHFWNTQENEAMHYEHPIDGGVSRMTRRIDALLMTAFAAICLLSGTAGAQRRQRQREVYNPGQFHRQ
jgi:hypothetical protein